MIQNPTKKIILYKHEYVPKSDDNIVYLDKNTFVKPQVIRQHFDNSLFAQKHEEIVAFLNKIILNEEITPEELTIVD